MNQNGCSQTTKPLEGISKLNLSVSSLVVFIVLFVHRYQPIYPGLYIAYCNLSDNHFPSEIIWEPLSSVQELIQAPFLLHREHSSGHHLLVGVLTRCCFSYSCRGVSHYRAPVDLYLHYIIQRMGAIHLYDDLYLLLNESTTCKHLVQDLWHLSSPYSLFRSEFLMTCCLSSGWEH